MRGNLQGWYKRLHQARTNKDNPRDISFRQFLTEQAQANNDDPQNLTPERVIAALFPGRNPGSISFKELHDDEDGFYVAAEIVRHAIDRGMRGLTLRQDLNQQQMLNAIFSHAPVQTDPANRFITPELFLPWINRGVVQGEYWQDLISNDIAVSQPQFTMPLMSLSDAGLEERTEGAAAREGTVTYGSKSVTVKERRKAIYFTDESIMFNSVNLVSVFFEDLGRLLGAGLNGEAVRVLLDGDQSDGSEAATVIGVTAAGTLAYKDIARVWVRMGLIHRIVRQILANEDMTLDYLDLTEVKNTRFDGLPLLETRLRQPLPNMMDLFPAFKVPANKLCLSDPSMAMVALTAKPLTLEQERIIARSLNGTHATIWKGFAIQQANARVVIDRSVNFNSNQWTAAFSGNQETW